MQSSDVCLEGKCSIARETDLVGDEIDYLITELEECRRKCMTLSEKIENRKKLKRELNTGLPNLACFHFTLKLIQLYTDKIKFGTRQKMSNHTIRVMRQKESLADKANCL